MMLLQFIVLQVIVFGAVIYFLKRIFHGDTNSAIQRLGHVHQEMLEKQAELSAQNELIDKELQAKKEAAVTVAEKIKQEILAEVRKKEDEVMRVARAQAEEIISKAQGAREDMAKEIRSELSKKMIGFSAEVIQQALSRNMAETVHRTLIHDFISKAKETDLSSVGAGVEEIFIRSPFPLAADELEKFNTLVTTKVGRSIKLNELRDAEILGGVVMQFGTLVLDGSLGALLRDAAAHVQEKY